MVDGGSALLRRAGWGWPLALAFVRLPLVVLGVALATLGFALAGAPDPLLLGLTTPPAVMFGVNMVSLWLLSRAVAREGLRLRDLIGFDRSRLGRDVLLGVVWLVVLNVPFMATVVLLTILLTRPADAAALGAGFGEVFAGRSAEAYAAVDLPLWWAVFVGLSFALVNPLVEEMHYRGYVQPRLTALSGSASIGIGVMAIGFAAQHIAYASTPAAAVVYFAAFLVWGTIAGLIYRRVRRLPSLVVAHFVVNASFGALPIVFALMAATPA